MLTEEQLQAIEDCGSAEMPIDETCIIAECAQAEFLASEEARARYNKGHLLSKLSIRQACVRMAREGVPQMVKIYQEFAKPALPLEEKEPDWGEELPELPDMEFDDANEN